jgi:hypothetical protein
MGVPAKHTRIQVVNSKPSHPRGETFIQPKLAPPIHGDQVSKPLVGKLMRYNVGDSVSVAVC